ncbi:MAG: ATP-grasp domain-containing protein [Chromatiales bacterium]|nr:ATP-grasp domain-containing protein [Chromatiales bacterium]
MNQGSEAPRTTVLVLDAMQRSALATTRSLGRSGCKVITADSSQKSLAGSSRHSHAHWVYPDPYSQPSAFVDWAKSALNRQAVQVAMPMTEVTTDLLVRNSQHWPNVLLPYAPINRIDQLCDKARLMIRASELGIPIPFTMHINNPGGQLPDPEALHYPLVLKPTRSRIMLDSHWLNTAVNIVHNAKELRDALTTEAFRNHPFMIQDYIDGTGQGIFALYGHGTSLAFFSHRRIRERPPWGGVSVLSESVKPDPLLQTLAQRLLDDAQWHGVAMVEFKVARDGTPYLMEINTRFWGSLQLAIDAGIDFPVMLLDLAFGKPIKPPDIREHIKLRWLLGDMDHLYLTWRSRRYSLAHKLRTTAALLKPDLSGMTRHEVNRLGDMKPAWHELTAYFS